MKRFVPISFDPKQFATELRDCAWAASLDEREFRQRSD